MLKTFDITIPILKGEDNLNQWKVNLKRALQLQKLDKYIFTNVEKPVDAEAIEKWTEERIKVSHALGSSLTDKKIKQMLVNNGWDIAEEDPKVTYDLVLKTVTGISAISTLSLINEVVTIKRSAFATIADFINRI